MDCKSSLRDGFRVVLLGGLIALVWACRGDPVSQLSYPDSLRVDQRDVYHGVTVADPYRWLEALDAADTQTWVAAQNRLTDGYLQQLPQRPWFKERLASLIDYERFGVPEQRGGVYVFEHNTGRQEQDVIRVSDAAYDLGRIVVDPNAMAADGSISVPSWSLSPDGRYLAYAVSVGGSDWDSWRIQDLDGDSELPDRIEGTKFSGVAWLPDASGFFYSRYPQTDGEYDDSQQVRIYFHRLGQKQSYDERVYEVTDHPTRNPYATVSEDGQFLLITLFDGYETSGLYYQRLADGKPEGAVVRLLDAWDARYQFIGNTDNELFVLTTRDAPKGRVVAIDLARPEPQDWREVVPESDDTIEAVSFLGGQLFVEAIRDARARLRRFSVAGEDLGDLALPGIGSVSGLSGRAMEKDIFFAYTDYTTPWTVLRHEVGQEAATALRNSAAGLNPADYTTHQVFYESRDGTRIPMTIVTPANREPGAPSPLVLYGYGGFNVSLLPGYSTSRAAWLQAGGSYAVANLRGGGEYGEAWHRAGTKLNKQNVFDDFIAAAEWLIDNGYTTPDQLTIWGGSNGGLLVAAVARQRPDLFAVAVPAVGVLDMLRYDLASANARQWSSDYGLSSNAEEFAALYAYSPYHNLETGGCYPATLVMADANDDRVVPWHSYKYAAALQYAQDCDKPALIRIETNTGHGAGASVSKIINEYADQWAFVANVTGLDPAGG